MIYKNSYNDIYIEINGRQTGKTHRMVEDIIKYINKTNDCVYILTNKKMIFYSIKNRVIGIMNAMNVNIDINKIVYINDARILNKKERIYIDEFAFIDNLDEKITIRPNMYFVTSPNENNNSEIVKTLMNFTHWKRKKIIDKLLNNSK